MSGKKSLTSGAIILSGQLFKIPLQFASLAFLSRLLDPNDFGLVAFCLVFVAFGDIIRDIGLSTAMLQQEKYSKVDASNAFWANTALGSLIWVASFALGPLLAAMLNEPAYTLLLPSLTLGLVFNAMQAQFQISLAKQGRFSYIALSEVCAQIVSVFIAIGLAAVGWGYWALATQAVSLALLILVQRVIGSKWVPSKFIPYEGGFMPFKQGLKHTTVQFLSVSGHNADTAAIGVFQGPATLGFYTRAFQIYAIPKLNLVDTLTQLVVTRALEIKQLKMDLHHFMRNVQFLLGFVISSIFVLMAGTAGITLPLVLGEGWEPSEKVLSILALAGLFAVSESITYWLFLVSNKNTEFLKWRVKALPIKILMLVAAAPFGINVVAYALLASSFILWPLNFLALAAAARFRVMGYFKDSVMILASGIATYLVLAFVVDLAQGLDTIVVLALASLLVPVIMSLVLCTFKSTRVRLFYCLSVPRRIFEKK